MASALTIQATRPAREDASANCRAAADLPLAVGPAISTTRADPIASNESSMSQVLSLIAADAKTLGAADTDAARRAIDSGSAGSGAPDWLAPGEACDIFFAGD